MVYLKRKIDNYLEEWKKDAYHNPLIVQGARQVGKTESIRRFAKKNYKHFIEINFVEEPEYLSIVSDGYKPTDIIRNITRIDPFKKFSEGETLLFFDEIQKFPDIVTSLKFFKQDGKYDVICSGSLLGINYKHISSISVGYKQDYFMTSLDFEEFLWALGYEDASEDLLGHMKTLTPFNETSMKVYASLFLDFCILGGLPSVIRRYVETKSFSGTLAIQRQLLEDYRGDIRQYAEGLDQARILNVFDHIPSQLAKENKKFQLTKLPHGARFKDYRGCIEWLKDAGMVNACYCMEFPELPLKGNYDETKYKLYFFDTGLLIASLDEEAQDDLRINKNLGVYKGAVYENIVGEALKKSGYDLYYYKRENSTLEEDFFIRSKNGLLPVEVKAKKGYAKALRTLIEDDRYPDIKYGIKLSLNNIGYADHIYTFPYFCTFLLKRYLKDFD